MRIKKVWKRVIIFIVILVLIFLAVVLLVRFTPQPPKEKVAYARIALSEATSNKADTYSKNLYREAKALYDSAMINWQEENKQFYIFQEL